MKQPTKREPGQLKRKDFLKFIIVFSILTVALPLVTFIMPRMENLSARHNGTPQECTAVAMGTKSSGKSFINYTTFVTEDGKKVEVRSSYEDYVGRKTTLLVYKNEACRQNYEVPKLTTIFIVWSIFMVLGWGGLIYTLVRKKIKIVKE
ncbi:hypothetical protein [Ruminococcus sp. FC2018]|uniref:hypothetical protein n=1 Tax=Ruminococcus sp. FC2018 TaxID=1410617 RepID=UPI00048FCB3C|nr:hypothetical protein [Ruminococcus sp. FC2018]